MVPAANCATASNATFVVNAATGTVRLADGSGCLLRTSDVYDVTLGPCDGSPAATWTLVNCTAKGCVHDNTMQWLQSGMSDAKVLGLPGAVGPYTSVYAADNPTGKLHNELWTYNASDQTIRSLCTCSRPAGMLDGCLAGLWPPPPPPPCRLLPRVRCHTASWVDELPSNTPSTTVVGGPLLGNGDLGAVLGAANGGRTLTWYFGKADLWTTNSDVDARSPELHADTFYKQIGAGTLTLTLAGPGCAGAPLAFNASQDLYAGAVSVVTACGTEGPRLFIDARVSAAPASSNALLLNVSCPACTAAHNVTVVLSTAPSSFLTRASTENDTVFVAKDGVAETLNSVLLAACDPNSIVWPAVRTFALDKASGRLSLANGSNTDTCLRLVQTAAFPDNRIVTGPCTGGAADEWYLRPAPSAIGGQLLVSGLNASLCAARETPFTPYHASAGFVVPMACTAVTQGWTYDAGSGQLRYNATTCAAAVPPNVNVSVALVPVHDAIGAAWSIATASGVVQSVVGGASLARNGGVHLAVGVASTRDALNGMNAVQAAANARSIVASPAAFSAAVTAHGAWWQDYWNRSALQLDDQRQVLEAYWYGMQYMLGSTARPGKVAPGLWGVWAVTDSSAWNGVSWARQGLSLSGDVEHYETAARTGGAEQVIPEHVLVSVILVLAVFSLD